MSFIFLCPQHSIPTFWWYFYFCTDYCKPFHHVQHQLVSSFVHRKRENTFGKGTAIELKSSCSSSSHSSHFAMVVCFKTLSICLLSRKKWCLQHKTTTWPQTNWVLLLLHLAWTSLNQLGASTRLLGYWLNQEISTEVSCISKINSLHKASEPLILTSFGSTSLPLVSTR